MSLSSTEEKGREALEKLKSIEPPQWLTPSPSLSEAARAASQYLFSSLKPYASSKSPFDSLLVDGFDAEQIWQQIDLLSLPLLSGIRRKVRDFEKNPEEIGEFVKRANGGIDHIVDNDGDDDDGMDVDGGGDDDDDDEDDDDDDVDEDEVEEEAEGESGDGDAEGEGKEEGGGGIEDKFLKIKELEEYLEEDEAREYGLDKNNDDKKKKKKKSAEDEDGDEDEGEDQDEDEENELGVFGDGGDEDEDEKGDNLDDIRYEDFFGGTKKTVSKGKSRLIDESEEESGSDEEALNKKKGKLSTHEKELEKLRAEIEEMEKANIGSKHWTMQGEVTAAGRPKNSALEVDLDFEHNVRPAPVITEEVSASLEEMIKNRIIDGLFDDRQKVTSLPSNAPHKLKELDENKSKKGLAEVYEEEYVQKTHPAAAPLSFSDEQKKEASLLFKKLCLKLDALSHFHFAPKPVVEDMTIQANVPALAMEEIAPVAVSDAAMLAPEEVFSGKGDVKEETELTQAERKRRRAKKKRKFKAEEAKKMAKRPRNNASLSHNDDNWFSLL